jgi:hypothetical protein
MNDLLLFLMFFDLFALIALGLFLLSVAYEHNNKIIDTSWDWSNRDDKRSIYYKGKSNE